MNFGELRTKNREVRNIMDLLRQSQPVLKDPEGLTESIMAEISRVPAGKAVSVLSVIQRVLAAASVALMLIFGYEQFMIVEKVTGLEVRFSQIKPDPRYSDPFRLASDIELSKAGISFADIEKQFSMMRDKAPLSYIIIKKRLDLKQ